MVPQLASAMSSVSLSVRCWRFRATTGLVLLLATMLHSAMAQGRLERSGTTLYWGLVPAAIVATEHDLADLHGGLPRLDGQVYHLVVALYNSATGSRIEDAVVRAQLGEAGIVHGPVKYLVPMKVNDQASYGQFFGVATGGPYRIRFWVRPPPWTTEIEFSSEAWPSDRSGQPGAVR